MPRKSSRLGRVDKGVAKQAIDERIDGIPNLEIWRPLTKKEAERFFDAMSRDKEFMKLHQASVADAEAGRTLSMKNLERLIRKCASSKNRLVSLDDGGIKTLRSCLFTASQLVAMAEEIPDGGITVGETAEILKMTRKSVWRLISEGRIRANRLSRRVALVNTLSVRRFMKDTNRPLPRFRNRKKNRRKRG